METYTYPIEEACPNCGERRTERLDIIECYNMAATIKCQSCGTQYNIEDNQ